MSDRELRSLERAMAGPGVPDLEAFGALEAARSRAGLCPWCGKPRDDWGGASPMFTEALRHPCAVCAFDTCLGILTSACDAEWRRISWIRWPKKDPGNVGLRLAARALSSLRPRPVRARGMPDEAASVAHVATHADGPVHAFAMAFADPGAPGRPTTLGLAVLDSPTEPALDSVWSLTRGIDPASGHVLEQLVPDYRRWADSDGWPDGRLDTRRISADWRVCELWLSRRETEEADGTEGTVARLPAGGVRRRARRGARQEGGGARP